MGFISPPPLLLLFSGRCAAAGISGDSLAASLQSSSLPAAMATAECLAAERSNGCGMRERSRPKQKRKKRTRERERVKKWESVVWRSSRATIMQRQKWGSWRDTRSQRTKMCVLLTPATGARLAACTFSHQPLPWKHATPVSKPAKRIMARARGGEERQTDIKTEKAWFNLQLQHFPRKSQGESSCPIWVQHTWYLWVIAEHFNMPHVSRTHPSHRPVVYLSSSVECFCADYSERNIYFCPALHQGGAEIYGMRAQQEI